MDRLNVFNPYKDKNDEHEDVLTRNFLILVKNIPSVQIAFFELVRAAMNTVEIESLALGEIEITEVRTQVKSGTYLANLQDYRVVSVLISDDKFDANHSVKASDRKAVYDGVICCDPSWVFVIENKPYVGNVWEGQLDPNSDDVKNNDLITEPCFLSWREIIKILNQIIDRRVVSYLEQVLIEDFLWFVDEKKSWLNPYNMFGFCKRDRWLLNKRCNQILLECFKGKDLNYHNGWKYYIDTSSEDPVVSELALDNEGENIKLWMYAGEKNDSARAFYYNFDEDKARELVAQKFLLVPNFHFAYQGSGLISLKTSRIDVFEYINYWKNEGVRQVKRDEFENYYSSLVQSKIVDPNDEEISNKIRGKHYPNFNVRAGVLLAYEWPLDEAITLDKNGLFVEDCLDKIKSIRSIYMHD